MFGAGPRAARMLAHPERPSRGLALPLIKGPGRPCDETRALMCPPHARGGRPPRAVWPCRCRATAMSLLCCPWHDCPVISLPWPCHYRSIVISSALPLSSPCHCHGTAVPLPRMSLPTDRCDKHCHAHVVAIVAMSSSRRLSCCCHVVAPLVRPCHSHVVAISLPMCYHTYDCHVVAASLPPRCHVLAALLPCSCQCVAMSWPCHRPAFTLLLPHCSCVATSDIHIVAIS